MFRCDSSIDAHTEREENMLSYCGYQEVEDDQNLMAYTQRYAVFKNILKKSYMILTHYYLSIV